MHHNLVLALWPNTHSKLKRDVLLVVAGSILLTLSAKLSIPFYPVPMTMQTFAVLVLGLAYGWRLGGITILLYLAEGAVGFPVFSGTPGQGIGLAYMMGGTGGYLLGFVFAASLCGYLGERGWDRNIWTTALAMLLGTIIIYTLGLLWLGSLYGWDKPIFTWGLTPFILGDITKIALAAMTMPLCWRLLGRRNK